MKVIGLDRSTCGQSINHQGIPAHFTGYFQYEGNNLYWQLLDTSKTVIWARLDLVPSQVDYMGEV